MKAAARADSLTPHGYGMVQRFLRRTAAGTSERAAATLGWLFIRRNNRTLLIRCGVFVALTVVAVAPAISAVVSGDLGALGKPAQEPSSVAYAAGEQNR